MLKRPAEECNWFAPAGGPSKLIFQRTLFERPFFLERSHPAVEGTQPPRFIEQQNVVSIRIFQTSRSCRDREPPRCKTLFRPSCSPQPACLARPEDRQDASFFSPRCADLPQEQLKSFVYSLLRSYISCPMCPRAGRSYGAMVPSLFGAIL